MYTHAVHKKFRSALGAHAPQNARRHYTLSVKLASGGLAPPPPQNFVVRLSSHRSTRFEAYLTEPLQTIAGHSSGMHDVTSQHLRRCRERFHYTGCYQENTLKRFL